ncbi:MAG: AMP-binding protein [Pseudomonadota bacterium]
MLPRDMLARCAGNYPQKVAYYCGDDQRTWRQMHERSNALASALQELGVRKGDVVSILGNESIDIYEHYFACMKIGAIRVGVNWRFAMSEILHVLRDSSTKVLFVQTNCIDMEPLWRDIEALGIRLIGYGGKHDLPLDYETLLSEVASASPTLPPLSEDDDLFISYTSGTTGHSKGAMLTHGAVAKSIFQSVINGGFSPGDIWYMPTQSAWITVVMGTFGLGNGMSQVISKGGFDPAQFLRDVSKLRVTTAVLPPVMLSRVIQEYKSGTYDFSSMRVLTFGSSPAAPKLIRDAYATFGCELNQPYAMTENAGCWVTCFPPADYRHALEHEPALLASVGRVGVMCEISIRDRDGKPVPVDVEGEVWIKSETIMKGYVNLPEQTAETLHDGWLSTNDIGRMDERGYLYLMDRKKFMIITGGVNVFPAAVEAVVIEHPAVDEVAVVGVPSPEWGEAVVGIVKLKDGITPPVVQELISFCQQRLGKVQSPKHFLFIDELPRTSTGKVQKHRVREWVFANVDLLPWKMDDTD